MNYTREMEQSFQSAYDAVKSAEDVLLPLKTARHDAMGRLGGLLLKCPLNSGTHSAAAWASCYADELTELLAPFIKQPETS